MSTEGKTEAVRLKEVADGVPFEFVSAEFDGICYQMRGVIYRWKNGATLGVCAGIRDENPLVIVSNNSPDPYM